MDFETSPPAEIVSWARQEYGSGLVVTASFEDAVLVHAVAAVDPSIEVVLLDTQYLFAETHWYAQEISTRLRLNLRIEHPLVEPDNRWQYDTESCCDVRKVQPLARALQGRTAWITGIRRADGPSRANAPIVSFDERRGVTKINPLATMSDDDFARYELEHNLLAHPLRERGYASIGCWPCTRPVAPGEDRRAGRWAGSVKTECGLHT